MLSQRDFLKVAYLQVCLCILHFFIILKSKQRFKSLRWRCSLIKYILFWVWFESFMTIYLGIILYQLDSALWLWLVLTWLCLHVIEVKDVLALWLYWEKRISCRSIDLVLFVWREVGGKVLRLADWAVDLWKAGLGLLPAMVLLSRTLKLMCFFASLFSIKSCFFDGLARVRDDYTSRVTQL